MTWQPSADQAHAISVIKEKFEAGEEIRLGGLAGTGKTEILSRLPRFLGVKDYEILYLAPTNKAAVVLRSRLRKAGTNSQTITGHKFMYRRPEVVHCAACVEGRDVCHVDSKVRREAPCGCGRLIFIPKKITNFYSLVVCDEASMVGSELYGHLKESGVQILFSGDHGQLRPVDRGNPGFSLMDPKALDVRLETPHRQVAGSKILWAARQARTGKRIEKGVYGKRKEVMIRSWTQKAVLNYVSDDPGRVFLAFRNKTVNHMNKLSRQILGMAGILDVGDRVMCKDNIRDDDVYSGMLGTVTDVMELPNGVLRASVLLDNENRTWTGFVEMWSSRYDRESKITKYPKGQRVSKWQYGYCLTVHSAQGSEWDRVVVVDDYVGTERANWLYTAITRASRRVRILKNG